MLNISKSTTILQTAVKATDLIYFTDQDRSIFFAIVVLIYSIAAAGNIAAIIVTINRKHRFVQKVCIISLSLSDFCLATIVTTNNLDMFSHSLINWTLGEFMCAFVPFGQMFGITASSLALLGIAVDRYLNVVHALRKRWNPSVKSCLLGVTLVWIVSILVSVPMCFLYQHVQVKVLFYRDQIPYIEIMYLCLSFKKEELKTYYVCMAMIIFLPLLFVFLWLYYNVASLIWKHRKPLSTRFYKNKETPASLETSTTQVKNSETSTKIPSRESHVKKVISKNASIQVERKIRTFKIIIMLMLIFFVCRLPYWIFTVLKLTHSEYKEHLHWIINYSFYCLCLLNCALNPLLYAFLNATLHIFMKIHKTLNDFMCKVCCCCFSNTEFEEFEKENPFIVENFDKRQSLGFQNLQPRHSHDIEQLGAKNSNNGKYNNFETY